MNKRQLWSSLLAVSLIATPLSAAPVHAATGFSDISGSFAKDAILELVEKGILVGNDGKFNPSGSINRQDFAIILAKALKFDLSDAPATPTFSDVPPDSYSYKYVEAAKKAGLIAGMGNGKFGAGATLSRQDMAVIFIRALGVDVAGMGATLKFSDSASIADYAKDAVGAALELGLIAGGTDNRFNPTGTADRQAVALVASKFMKTVEETKKPSPSPSPEPSPSPSPSPSPEPSTPSPSRDTTPPSADASKFVAVDNYAGTPDRLQGSSGAIGESGASVKVYRWMLDSNENGKVDASELGEPISLGTSASDGSVAASSIGDLQEGYYRFIITATDAAGNESARDAVHVVTVTLTKNKSPKQAVFYGWTDDTSSGTIGPTSATVSSAVYSDLRFDVVLPETFTEGTLELTAEGTTFTTLDVFKTMTTDAGAWQFLSNGQIGDDGHTLTLTGSFAEGTRIAVRLNHRKFPPGIYSLELRMDADGAGITRTFSDAQYLSIESMSPEP